MPSKGVPSVEPVESDPNVTSTVEESELLDTQSASEKTEVISQSKSPAWQIMPLNLDDTSVPSGARTPSHLNDFEAPEFEFDDEIIDFEGYQDIDAYLDIEATEYNYDLFTDGRITPDGLIDDDFERELGWYEKELCVQEVIDSDFRDISRLGILHPGGTDRMGRKVIAFFACRLPPTDLIDHDRLLEYVTKTLEQYVSSDYVLIYFHWGLTSRNKPKFSWLVRAHKTFGRSFRKNLKSLIIVYPTRTVKMLWNLFSTLVSVKMKKKLLYVNNLLELEDHITVCRLNLPLRIRDYDSRISSLGVPDVLRPPAASVMGDNEEDDTPCYQHQQFGVTLQYIKANNGGRSIPIVIEDAVTYIKQYGLDTPGIFVKPVKTIVLRDLQSMYNRGDFVDLCETDDPHLAAQLLKSFLCELKEPLMTFDLYGKVLDSCAQNPERRLDSIRQLLTTNLPSENYAVLFFIFHFLTEVLQHSSKNMVTAANVSVALGPCLVRSRQTTTVSQHPTTHNRIVSFTQLCITHFESLFVRL